MKIESHNNLKVNPPIEASRVVIYDKFDQPIVVVFAYETNDAGRDELFVKTCAEPDFNSTLESLGINKTVIASPLGQTDSKLYTGNNDG